MMEHPYLLLGNLCEIRAHDLKTKFRF